MLNPESRTLNPEPQGSLHARRQAAAVVRTDETLHKLFTSLALRYRWGWGWGWGRGRTGGGGGAARMGRGRPSFYEGLIVTRCL